MEEIIARNKWEKMISGAPYGIAKPVKITATAQLVKRSANDLPYFSLTGEISRNDRRYRDPIITCGQITDEILHHFPQLAPLAVVHLSDAGGHPIHSEANARYWAGLSTYPDGSPMGEYKPSMLARHLQADRKIADEVRQGLLMGLPWDRITADLGLKDLWSAQAGAARKLLNDVKAVANV
jgi:hypothetical protein